MIVGADTRTGRAITEMFLHPEREIRVFVSDPDVATEYRRVGAKVAIGDVSDDTHLTGACVNCFSVVLVGEAASDDRERAFAASPGKVMEAWARAVGNAGVNRVIWVTDDDPPPVEVDEVAVVDLGQPDLPGAVHRLDDAKSIR